MVDSNGKVAGVCAGVAVITATTNDGGYTANCTVTVKDLPALTEIGKTFKAVDLGLSVKWATFNLGATKPQASGDFFSWGETEPKSNYSWSTYKWCDGSDSS